MKIIFKIIILSILIFGCQSKIKTCEELETYSILSLLISNSIGPMNLPIQPPPPPELFDSVYIKKRDSVFQLRETEDWKNQKYIAAINPYLFHNNKFITIDSAFREKYNPLLEKFISLDKGINIKIDKIIPTRGNVFIIKPSDEELQDRESWNKFNEIFNCSRIVFNENCTRALTIIGVTREKLDGYSSLVLLEKIDGNWVQIHAKTLTIS